MISKNGFVPLTNGHGHKLLPFRILLLLLTLISDSVCHGESLFRRGNHQQMEWYHVRPLRIARSEILTSFLSTAKISLAHVEVDPIVMETSYGVIFMTDPLVLLEALSLSIELGILITVTVANCKTPIFHPSNRNLDYFPGDIIFIATDNNYQSEVVFVYKAQWTGRWSEHHTIYRFWRSILEISSASTIFYYCYSPLLLNTGLVSWCVHDTLFIKVLSYCLITIYLIYIIYIIYLI